MLIECGTKFSGHYHIKLIDSISGITKEERYLDNILSNVGLTAIATGTSVTTLFARLLVGQGITPPAVTDINLEKPGPVWGYVTYADITGVNTSPQYSYWRRTIEIAQGFGTGIISEMGMCTAGNGGIYVSANPGVLGSRVLVTDIVGNLAPIYKTASDRLMVEFELRLYADILDKIGNQALSGSIVNYTIRPQGVGLSNWTAAISSIGSWNNAYAYAHQSQVITSYTTTNNPSPKILASTTILEPYVNNQYRDLTFKWSASSTSNNIGLITVSPWVAGDGNQMWQIYFNPVIPKTTDNRLAVTFRQYFGRL